ncbi:MAG: phage regulatory CII family protein [Myxococcota bacterium]
MNRLERHGWAIQRWAEILDTTSNITDLAQRMGYDKSTLYRAAEGQMPISTTLARDYLRATGDDRGFAELTGAADCGRVVAEIPHGESDSNLGTAAYNVRAAIALLDRVTTEALADGVIDVGESLEIDAAIRAAQEALEGKRATVHLVTKGAPV